MDRRSILKFLGAAPVAASMGGTPVPSHLGKVSAAMPSPTMGYSDVAEPTTSPFDYANKVMEQQKWEKRRRIHEKAKQKAVAYLVKHGVLPDEILQNYRREAQSLLYFPGHIEHLKFSRPVKERMYVEHMVKVRLQQIGFQNSPETRSRLSNLLSKLDIHVW